MIENERREREAFEGLSAKLWCDLRTDEERSAWLLLGRGHETGVVAKALQNDLAMAYHRLALLSASTPSEQDGWIRVDEVHAIIQQARDSICAGGLAENAQHERSVVEPYLDGISDELDELSRAATPPAPIDMVLHCPACGMQHIDKPEGQFYPGMTADESAYTNKLYGLWDNPPHRSHLCHGCGHIWRPADVPTNGVQAVKTAGKADSPIAATPPAVSAEALHGFSRDDLECIAEGLEKGYERTVNVGNTTGEGDEHIESTTAAAARFIRAAMGTQPAADNKENGNG